MGEPRPSRESAEGIRAAVREKYLAVAASPGGRFPYPVGREGALALGYGADALDALPPGVVERFVGVGNPLRVRPPRPGERVLDLGCGAGVDVLLAAGMVGSRGRAVGVDLVPEMWAGSPSRAGFVAGDVEALPFPDGSFDLVVANGSLNLVPDKDAAFREIRRVLRPGGGFAAADLLVTEAVPAEVLADRDAWST